MKEANRLTINSPDDLDGLLESISAGTASSTSSGSGTAHEGEHLFATERLVVSPAAGVFTPDPAIEDGTQVARGTVLGTVGDVDVRSAFAGEVQGFLALVGERVTARQPIAWLRQV